MVSEVGLEAGLLDDCILMASELAANTLHAHTPQIPQIPGEPAAFAGPLPGCPELWLYLRGLGAQCPMAVATRA